MLVRRPFCMSERTKTLELTLPELKRARKFLRQAHMLTTGVSSLFFNAGERESSARLNNITIRLSDEIEKLDRRIEKPARGGHA